MKRMHLVTPRTGPFNAGGAICIECGMTIFLVGGELAYDVETELHTTDPTTYYAGEPGEYEPCNGEKPT